MSKKVNEPTVAYRAKRKTTLGDYYWAHADILRGIGIPPATYDQRVLAFMAIKLLIDNGKLKFNFEYKHQFGLSDTEYLNYCGETTQDTFRNLLENLPELGQNLNYFEQEASHNPGQEENVLYYINHPRVFPLTSYVDELENHYLEMILDIYTEKADFTNYPKEQYKDLYEKTVARMKTKFTGDLTGQHFTQKSIIHLMCEVALKEMKGKKHIAIYDPACGTGSMVMEAAYYFKERVPDAKIEVYGQEYSGQIWLLAKIFLEICQFNGGTGIYNQIAYGNTLTEPKFSKGINGDDSFDFIIANPPFGVDWKHDYDKVLKNLARPDSDFLVVHDGKKFITPKKSDGQFLFMMHIIKLMQEEKKRNKHAVAAVISSSTLSSTGAATGSEAKIRSRIFETGILKALVEQPNAMFTNTDISSHIWFLDNNSTDTTKLLKVDNGEEPLHIPHPQPQDKMRNAYSAENIKRIVKLLSLKKEEKYVSKNVQTAGRHELNLNQLIEKPNPVQDVDLGAVEAEIKRLITELYESMNNDTIWMKKY